MKYIVETFESVNEFCRELNKRPACKGAGCSSTYGSEHFTMTKNYEQADEFARCGDRDSLSKINASFSKLYNGKHEWEQRTQVRVHRSVVGTRPCVPAAIMGHPQAMFRKDKMQTKRPVVDVFYNIGACGDIAAERLADFGVKVVEAVRSVERSGVRVNLYAGNCSRAGEQGSVVFVRIKDSSHDLDLLRMAYPIINPSFFRRHWFRWVETKPELSQSRWSSGYGRSVDESEEVEFFKELKKPNAVFISFYGDNKKTSKQLADKILKK